MRNELTGYLLPAEEYGEVFVKEGIVFDFGDFFVRFEVLMCLRKVFIYILSEALPNLKCTFAVFPVYKP